MAARRTVLTFTDGITPVVQADGMTHVGVYLKGNGGTLDAGVVTLETADAMPATDAPSGSSGWAATALTLNASGASAGAQAYGVLATGAYSLLRLRVTTPLGGGGAVTAVIVMTGP